MEELRELTAAEIEAIYETCLPLDFPPEEIKPLARILSMKNEGKYTALGIYAEGTLLGYAFLSQARFGETDERIVLLDYFAILAAYRDRGLGGRILRRLAGYYADAEGLLIETEDADFAETDAERTLRQKRDAFYERNGAARTGVKGKIYTARYALWALPAERADGGKPALPLSEEAYRERYREIYRQMIPGEKNKRHVEIS